MAIYRAKEPFAYTDKQGIPRVVRAGDLFDENDPCVKQRGHLFEPVEVAAERRAPKVEQATAEPGERRSVSTTRRPRTEQKDDNKGDG